MAAIECARCKKAASHTIAEDLHWALGLDEHVRAGICAACLPALVERMPNVERQLRALGATPEQAQRITREALDLKPIGDKTN
jgi:hypothetical protein